MKKTLCILLALLMIFGMVSCGSEDQVTPTPKPEPEPVPVEEGFKPSMDTSVKCHITIAGGYDNFEALETEFDRFNEYYPNVELVYTKIDDFNNMIGTVLNGNDAPIFTSTTHGCTAGISINPLSTTQ